MRILLVEDHPQLAESVAQALRGAGWTVDLLHDGIAADLALASQLINMEHGGETLDAGRWPNLLAHYERIKARASTQQLLPRELRTLEKIGAKR